LELSDCALIVFLLKTVSIRGESIAASCCASLLQRAGVPFVREKVSRPKLPAIMLSGTTQRLLTDIFPEAELFDGLPQIRRRVVKWNTGSPSLALPHSALVVSEPALLERIEGALLARPAKATENTAEWNILSARPLPKGSEEFHFGSREGTASAVTLKQGCDGETSWVESLPNGWLFLLPDGAHAWLLSVGGPAQSLLAESSLIAAQIFSVDSDGQSFPCHPRIADPLSGPGWLACGSAALGFDPLCGDGSGHAAREAILASAVVRAAMQGGSVSELIAHYHARLLAGFERHLAVCSEFYRSGAGGAWWDEQIRATEQGLTWCQAKLAAAGAFKYRLDGFSLETVC
jgi:hypothetical protein